jgi:Glycosyl transferase family 2
MNTPKVTVMMAVYNAGKYLRQAIESILSQSFGDFELLIHDDGSTDDSAQIIDSYRDSRIRAGRNPVNQGEERVRNHCLRVARGEYIAVLDADDIACQDRLQIQIDVLDRNNDMALVGSVYEIIDESGRVIGKQKVYSDELAIKWGLLFSNQFGHSTVMYRRKDVLAVGGYDETLPWGTDFDLWVRLAIRRRLANLKYPMSQYRIHTRNATHTMRSSVKENSLINVVAKSIYLQTGQTVDLSVASALSQDVPKPAASKQALKLAYGTICQSLGRFAESVASNQRAKEALVTLAVQDLFRLASKNPGSLGLALTKSLCSVARYDPHSLVRKPYVAAVANKIVPCGILRAVKRIS